MPAHEERLRRRQRCATMLEHGVMSISRLCYAAHKADCTGLCSGRAHRPLGELSWRQPDDLSCESIAHFGCVLADDALASLQDALAQCTPRRPCQCIRQRSGFMHPLLALDSLHHSAASECGVAGV